ncbi:MAG TPA: T9SS type A sorting domain-containing protein [Saprospiraceae bacterium]|nr:T9SS type A sorting domain-containing protein [Saprospiraceae bacterium]
MKKYIKLLLSHNTKSFIRPDLRPLFIIVLVFAASHLAFTQKGLYQYEESRIKSLPYHQDPVDLNGKALELRQSLLPGQWSRDFTVPGITGSIFVSATDGTNLYVGGQFKTAGGVEANGIAKWDGQKWSSLGVGPENGVSGDVPQVEAIAYLDGRLYIGGQFSKAGSKTVNGVAYWDGNQWNTLGPDSANGVRRIFIINNDTIIGRGAVWALFAHQQKIYIGGHFQYAGDSLANGITPWDPATGIWESFDGGFRGSSDTDPVYAYSFAAKGSDLYAGGIFSTAGGVPAKNIAKWDGTNWIAIGNAENPVNDLRFDHAGKLLAVGYFNTNDQKGTTRIGKWDGSTWTPVAGPKGLGTYISQFQVYGDTIYAWGSFDTLGYTLASLARLEGGNWQLLGGLGRAANEFLPGNVFGVELINNKLYVCGSFTKAGDLFPVNVVEWDLQNSKWKLLDDGGANQGIHDGNIDVLEPAGKGLYAGGSFSVAGSQYTRNIAQWNGNKWESLGTGYNNGIRGTVLSILVDSNDIYVGGYFGIAGTSEAFHVAKWDGNSWSPIGIGVGGVAGAHVKALAKVGHYLYVGGYFKVVGDAENYALPANSIARFDLITKRWETLGQGIEYVFGIPGAVYDMEVDGDKIYVAGEFNSVDDKFYQNFAVLTNNKWSGIGDNHEIGIEGSARCVKLIGDDLYIGGILRLERMGESVGILKWDGKKWIAVGEPLTADGRTVYVNNIVPHQNGLIAGGFFQKAGNKTVNHIAFYDGMEWNELGSGVIPGGLKIAKWGNKLFAAGPFDYVTAEGPGAGIAQFEFDASTPSKDIVLPGALPLIKAYPNPARDFFSIDLSGDFNRGTLELFDPGGRLVRVYSLAGAPSRFLTKGLHPGIYTFRVRSGKQILGGNKLLVE